MDAITHAGGSLCSPVVVLGEGTYRGASIVSHTERATQSFVIQRMTSGADQFRLTVASFDDAAGLWRAMEALLQDGITRGQICVLAPAESMPRLDVAEEGSMPETFSDGWLPPLKSWRDESGSRSIVATAGPLLDALSSLSDSTSNLANPTPSRGVVLSDYVVQNAITLVVRSTSPAQQSLTARTLLKQSSYRVRTFEFAVGRPTA